MTSDDSIKDLQLRVHDLERDCVDMKKINDKNDDNYKVMRKDLDTMVKLINQIKYTIIGGVGFFILSEVGITDFLKGLL